MSKNEKSVSVKDSVANKSVGKTRLGWQARIVLGFIYSLGLLPLSWVRAAGNGIGRIVWWSNSRGPKVTMANLRICYPDLGEPEIIALAKQSLKETGKLATEICILHNRPFPWLKARILKVHGEAMFREKIAQGKGVILLAPHLGNWEVLSQCLPTYAPLTALYQPPKQAYLESLVKSSREKTGATLVPTNRRGLSQLLASLRKGGITAVLPDQIPADGSGEFAPFFGESAYTMTLVYGFVRRVQCPLVTAFAKRVPGGYEVYFMEPPEAIYSEDVLTSVTALNKAVEECIAYCPEQYQWEYKRFKNDENGKQKHYWF